MPRPPADPRTQLGYLGALIEEIRPEDGPRSLGQQVVRLTWRDLYEPALVGRLIKEAFSRT